MIITILWLMLSAFLFGVGEYLSKKWSIEPSVKLGSLLVSMYALGALAWMPAIYRGRSLSVVGSMWNLLSFCLTLFVGLVIFKETLSTHQMVGVALAFIAIILLSI